MFRKAKKVIEVDDEFVVEMRCEHLAVELTVRVVHRECVGFRRHVYGVEFVGLDEGLRRRVEGLMEAACEPCACPSCWIAAA